MGSETAPVGSEAASVGSEATPVGSEAAPVESEPSTGAASDHKRSPRLQAVASDYRGGLRLQE